VSKPVRQGYTLEECAAMGRVDHAKLATVTEEDIERWKAEDDAEAGVPPGTPDVPTNVRVEYPVKAIRERLGVTQEEFARMFRVSVGTLRGWEQRRRHPRGAALTLLRVIDQEPEAVRRALRQPEVAPAA
jgi:putative transcriptional regulator